MCATYDVMKQADNLTRNFSQQLCVTPTRLCTTAVQKRE